MNISEVKVDYSKYTEKDRLLVMFDLQDELRRAYKIPILNLDDPQDQHLAREFAWNVTEETGEVLEVNYGSKDNEHILDELADSTSFFLELLLMSGIVPTEWVPNEEVTGNDNLERWFNFVKKLQKNSVPQMLRESHSLFVQMLSLAINRLKNRKWRKTNLKTNIMLYRGGLYHAFFSFVHFVILLGVTPEELFDSYLRKYEVNKFRIASKY